MPRIAPRKSHEKCIAHRFRLIKVVKHSKRTFNVSEKQCCDKYYVT